MKLHTALTIAGTDPSGGAGIMADLKSFQSRHVYGMAVVTSVVAQNTTGVHHVEHLSLECIDRQLHDVYSDIEPQAVKTGMIALPEMMDLIYPYVSKPIPYVMDPVMIATSGDRLCLSACNSWRVCPFALGRFPQSPSEAVCGLCGVQCLPSTLREFPPLPEAEGDISRIFYLQYEFFCSLNPAHTGNH